MKKLKSNQIRKLRKKNQCRQNNLNFERTTFFPKTYYESILKGVA